MARDVFNSGQRIGPYVVESPIGSGGQCDVYGGREPDEASEPVVIKVLAEHLKHDPKAKERFEEEADILTKLQHPAIVRLRRADTSPPIPYIAQEYIEGKSVATMLEERAPLDITLTLRMAVQVADALDYAHGLEYYRRHTTASGGTRTDSCTGIVHRDLSTDNILVTADNTIKLIDFGIARALGGPTITLTTVDASQLVGKYFYAAPELQSPEAAAEGPMLDVYSLGVCLYEMIMTGRPETERVRVLEQFRRHGDGLLGTFTPDVPQEVRELISRCVRREPKDRPVMTEVKEHLLKLVFETRTEPSLPPVALCISTPLLRFDRELQLRALGITDEEAHATRLSSSQESKRLFATVSQTRVISSDFHGGNAQVRYVPDGQHLEVLAGTCGKEAVGMVAPRQSLAHLMESGHWNFTTFTEPMIGPTHGQDHISVIDDAVFVGDYGANQVWRVNWRTGQSVDQTPPGGLSKLGPLTVGEGRVFCVDMVRPSLHIAPVEDLAALGYVADLSGVGFPTSLAWYGGLLFVVDPQNRRLSIWSEDGTSVHDSALSWESDLEIYQAVMSPNGGELALLDHANGSIYFLTLCVPPMDLLLLHRALADCGVCERDLAYESLEATVLSFLRATLESERSQLAEGLLRRLDRLTDPNRSRDLLKISICRLLAVGDVTDGLVWLSRAVEAADALSNVADLDTASELRPRDDQGWVDMDLAKDVYGEQLARVNGYDADVRDKLGRILEYEGDWDGILAFEAEFLCQEPVQKTSWRETLERSFARARRAYKQLGRKPPRGIDIRTTDRFWQALSLLSQDKHKDAREILRICFLDKDYHHLEDSWARVMLSAYAASIKMSLCMTVEDWLEVYVCLLTLLREYPQLVGSSDDDSEDEGFGRFPSKYCASREQYQKDLAAARNQVLRMGGRLPEGA